MKRTISIALALVFALGMFVIPASANVYTVKSGDTLARIAQANNTTVEELVRLNSISNRNVIHVGQQLNLPGGSVNTGVGAMGPGMPETVVFPGGVAASTSIKYHGFGHDARGRLNPDGSGRSFNIVATYVLFDVDGRITDMQMDQYEIGSGWRVSGSSPNWTRTFSSWWQTNAAYTYDSANPAPGPRPSDPHTYERVRPNMFYNWPLQPTLEETLHWTDAQNTPGRLPGDTDARFPLQPVQTTTGYEFQQSALNWTTKREQGESYMMAAGSWVTQMDAFQRVFRGMTAWEVVEWYDLYTGSRGRPLPDDPDSLADIQKYGDLSDAERNMLRDVLASKATMSINDDHGNLVRAIKKAWDNKREVVNPGDVYTMGQGFHTSGRLNASTGYARSFNVVMANTLYDREGKIVDMIVDQLEVTPPYGSEFSTSHFNGWPGYAPTQGAAYTAWPIHYNTIQRFLDQVEAWETKRDKGESYMMTGGSWAYQMDAFQDAFRGMTAWEVVAWDEKFTDDVPNRGRVISKNLLDPSLADNATNRAMAAKYSALSDADQAYIDEVFASGATMSLTDDHGSILRAIVKTWEDKREVTFVPNPIGILPKAAAAPAAPVAAPAAAPAESGGTTATAPAASGGGAPRTVTGSSAGFGGANATVSVDLAADGAITAVRITASGTSGEPFHGQIMSSGLAAAFVRTNSSSPSDTVAGATVSANAVKAAVRAAIGR